MKKIALFLLLAGILTVAACSTTDDEEFGYSKGIDEDGYWKGITATDHVELVDIGSIEIPAEVHEVSKESLDEQINSVLAYFSKEEQVKDRPVESGDKVNIDYVGTVDGEAFEGGDTQGNGTDVVIGETQYIDDFLDQLIGKMPGETFDINVTFPDDYRVEELNGKDAVFRTTVNHISISNTPEPTDAFVAENLQETYGWTTVKEMEEGFTKELQDTSVSLYIQDYIVQNSEILETPETLITYQENAMVEYYKEYAKSSEMELDAFLSAYVGVENTETLLETYADDYVKAANYYLILQAIAESQKVTVTDEDITNYFKKNMELDDYSELEEHYGLPFIKMSVLQQKVLDTVVENATFK